MRNKPWGSPARKIQLINSPEKKLSFTTTRLINEGMRRRAVALEAAAQGLYGKKEPPK